VGGTPWWARRVTQTENPAAQAPAGGATEGLNQRTNTERSTSVLRARASVTVAPRPFSTEASPIIRRYTGVVIRRWLRTLAAALVLVLAGLPIAGLACAEECRPVLQQAATPTGQHSAHCHESGTGTSIASKADGTCSLGVLTETAARDRTTTVGDTSFATAVTLPVHPIHLSHDTAPASASVARLSGRPPGALVPLRI
jgi:hypothetical protein